MGLKKIVVFFLTGCVAIGMTGCAGRKNVLNDSEQTTQQVLDDNEIVLNPVLLNSSLTMLEEDFSAISFEGEDGFTKFLAEGGASSDGGVVSYLKQNLLSNIPKLTMGGNPFGCSTLLVQSENQGYYFGRNFDWNICKAMVVRSKPDQGYASISTVNTDFIQVGGLSLSSLPDQAQAIIGLYAPLDGMNEKGLAVSVNIIQDSADIAQNTDKPDITTTTAVRLLLNKAASVQEAIRLLEGYDLHASMGMMVHFAIADNEGNSVVVEYVDNKMIVTETPIVTNFYLAQGEKYGIGTAQSHQRYEILSKKLSENQGMNISGMRDALSSVSKKNFGEYESTEWSIVMDLKDGKATYYHRENYNQSYTFSLTD